MTKTIWVSTSAATTYVPREKPIQETVAPFTGSTSGAAPATTIKSDNTGQRILSIDGTWIPQPSFTSGGADQIETLRPSVISTTILSGNPPTITNPSYAYDVDTNHATTFGEWNAASELRTNNRVDAFTFITWAAKAQTWTSATINISRAYSDLTDGESAATTGSSSKTSSVLFEYYNGSTWTTLGTDTQSSIPTAPQTLSASISTSPTMNSIIVRVTMTRGGGGTIYEDGISLPGLTGSIDLKLFDIWIDGVYAGGAGNVTCNNLTVTGDATLQNKLYDGSGSAGTAGYILSSTGTKTAWVPDSVGSGTVTSITTTGANGVTISGGSTQTITTLGTFALALGAITPTSIATGTGSFTGDVEFASSIKSPNASNSPVTIAPDGTGDVHLNADSVRIGDNNADATLATRGTGDLIITTHEGSANEGIVRLYDGVNGDITLTPNGSGQVKVGTDQVVTLVASQTLTNKTISGSANTLSNIANASLTNSTISGVALGSNLNALTISSPLTGTSFNGSAAVSIGIPVATTSVNGYLSSADWTTFNNKGSGSVTSVAATVPSLLSISGSPITTSGTLAITYSGTALPVANGGTGLTTLTAGYIPYGAGTSAFGSSANLFWDSTNSRLGIGTASPAFKLHTYIASGTSMFKFESGANTGIYGYWTRPNQSYIQALNLDNNGDKDFSLYDATNSQVADRYYPSSAGYRAFFTNGSERVRIDSSGNVGIGISTVLANFGGYKTLELNGTTGGLLSLDSNGTNNLQMYTNGSTVNIVTIGALPLTFGTNSTERMRIDSSGNVILNNGSSSSGTSTATPKNIRFNNDFSSGYTDASLKLYLFNSGATIQGFTSGPAFDLQYHSSGSASGRHAWYVDNAELMRLNSTGLGIGTASPSAKLEVSGTSASGYIVSTITNLSSTGYAQNLMNIGASGANGQSGIFYAPTIFYKIGIVANDTTTPITFVNNNGTERMRIDSSGNVGIGTASPTNKLQVNGVMVGNNAAGSYTKGFGGILTTTTTSTPTGGSSGDFALIY